MTSICYQNSGNPHTTGKTGHRRETNMHQAKAVTNLSVSKILRFQKAENSFFLSLYQSYLIGLYIKQGSPLGAQQKSL